MAGKSARGADQEIPTEEDIRSIESELGFRFPESYREYVRLSGLSELRIRHRVLSPSEILQSQRFLPDRSHVPFADNGCGDLFAWPNTGANEPIVVFFDHETGNYSCQTDSFTDWLEKNVSI